jgi:hypothetical protein
VLRHEEDLMKKRVRRFLEAVLDSAARVLPYFAAWLVDRLRA